MRKLRFKEASKSMFPNTSEFVMWGHSNIVKCVRLLLFMGSTTTIISKQPVVRSTYSQRKQAPHAEPSGQHFFTFRRERSEYSYSSLKARGGGVSLLDADESGLGYSSRQTTRDGNRYSTAHHNARVYAPTHYETNTL